MIIQSNSLSIHASFFSFKQTLKIIIHRHLLTISSFLFTQERINEQMTSKNNYPPKCLISKLKEDERDERWDDLIARRNLP